MDRQHLFLVVVLGLICNSHGEFSGSQLEVTVRPGDNVTLYCDCKISTGVFIVWYRNCSHENQPLMALHVKPEVKRTNFQRNSPHFHFKKNQSSGSYDLLIVNVSKSHEGLYYCGTEEKQVKTKDNIIISSDEYKYSKNTTRIILNSSEPHCYQQHPEPPQDCGRCWMLLVSLCPVSAFLSTILCFLVVCLLCRKKAKESQADHQKQDTELNQVEDVCYAALDIRQASQRPKKKKTQMSDFSYSAINTSGMQ